MVPVVASGSFSNLGEAFPGSLDVQECQPGPAGDKILHMACILKLYSVPDLGKVCGWN